jgi:hypothetical protein
MQAVSRRWVERAGQFVTEELTHLADGVSSQSTVQAAALLQLPTHTAFHERAEALAPLLQVTASCPLIPPYICTCSAHGCSSCRALCSLWHGIGDRSHEPDALPAVLDNGCVTDAPSAVVCCR